MSQDVSNRLKDYRQEQDLNGTVVVIQALDHVAEEVPDAMARAKMAARVTPTRSHFAARGSKGPLKGTGSVQRWWQPTKEDKAILKEMATEAGVRGTPGILIAVALNEFLLGGAMWLAGVLRRQMVKIRPSRYRTIWALSRAYNVSSEIARLALVQLQCRPGVRALDSSRLARGH
ncbi:hypothetical protein ACFRR6_01590 [Streptomyces sp. NPDC056891]|uniref:hypothetical protein n=1 Tax=Streptomyces sp. NPDC056891 TaxID=3345961 RepID=UPI0036B8A784